MKGTQRTRGARRRVAEDTPTNAVDDITDVGDVGDVDDAVDDAAADADASRVIP
jgi:hypothetical protein